MAEEDVSLAGVPRQSQTDGKDLYDEEDPEVPADLFGMWGASSIADDEEESAAEEPAATDVTDDDLDTLVAPSILSIPADEGETEVTDDDLDDIRVPILSPGDSVSIPGVTVDSDPDSPISELSSPSLVEIVEDTAPEPEAATAQTATYVASEPLLCAEEPLVSEPEWAQLRNSLAVLKRLHAEGMSLAAIIAKLEK